MKITNKEKLRVVSRKRRHNRVRQKIHGTASRPRLSIFRSARYVVAQLINDDLGKTLVSVSDAEIKKVPASSDKSGKVARAYAAGQLLAERAAAVKITSAIFDRGGYRYHGRVAAVAEGARSAGLTV